MQNRRVKLAQSGIRSYRDDFSDAQKTSRDVDNLYKRRRVNACRDTKKLLRQTTSVYRARFSHVAVIDTASRSFAD